jgi:hypothetical protein
MRNLQFLLLTSCHATNLGCAASSLFGGQLIEIGGIPRQNTPTLILRGYEEY